MILVEIETGVQRRYGSPEALAAAIRRGELGPGAKVYHRARDQWVPITEHPAFRGPGLNDAPLPPLARNHWTFFPGPSQERSEDDAQATATPSPAGAASSAATGEAPAPAWRRALRTAFRRFRPAPKS